MLDELMAQVAQMQRHTATLGALMSSAQALAPPGARGTDPSGCVHLTLGADGLPTSIDVVAGWERRVGADGVGDAVVDAFHAAVHDRLETWSRALARDGWQARADQVHLGGTDGAGRGRPVPVPRPPVVERLDPRPLGDVTEDVLAALRDPAAFTGPPPAAGTGTDRSGHVAIAVSAAGLTSCSADGRWVAERSAAQLGTALAEALHAATADLRARVAQARPDAGRADGLDRLLAEAMALLSDAGRPVRPSRST